MRLSLSARPVYLFRNVVFGDVFTSESTCAHSQQFLSPTVVFSQLSQLSASTEPRPKREVCLLMNRRLGKSFPHIPHVCYARPHTPYILRIHDSHATHSIHTAQIPQICCMLHISHICHTDRNSLTCGEHSPEIHSHLHIALTTYVPHMPKKHVDPKLHSYLTHSNPVHDI